MPDHIADTGECMVHADEICMSCSIQDSCDLIRVLEDYQITTNASLRILSCAKYVPDTTSEYYVDHRSIDDLIDSVDKMEQEFAALIEYIQGLCDR